MKYTVNSQGNLETSFETEVFVDNGYSNRSLGKKTSEMELFRDSNNKPSFIEWIVNGGEYVEGIGLVFEGKTLVDYDGVFDLPKEAVLLIRKAGFRVPNSFL